MPAGAAMWPVVGLGSGKFGTPWARMQWATARSFCISWVLTGADVVGGPRYFAQARCAPWNVGEGASLSEIWAIWPLAALMASDDPKEAASGKLKTPCERMQLAYSPSSPPGDEPPVVAATADAAVVVVPRRGTVGEVFPELQAVTASADMSSGPAASRHHRRLDSRWSRVRAWCMRRPYDWPDNTAITPWAS